MHPRIGHTDPLFCHNDLDPMTLVYENDPNIPEYQKYRL